jgi:hypothetical protein
MEGTALYNIIRTLEKPTPIQDLNEMTKNIAVVIHKNSNPETIIVENIAPFYTIEDLARAIYVQTEDSELFPRYSFLCTVENGEFFPSILTWIQADEIPIHLSDPQDIISNKLYQDYFVEDDGSLKISTRLLPRGRVTLEDAYLSSGEIPEFHIFSLQYLLSLYPGPRPISEKDWNGLFYPYFHQVDRQGTYSMDSQDDKFSNELKIYIESKQQLLEKLNTLLDSTPSLHELTTTNLKYLSLIWKDNNPGFEGVDVFFYSSPVDKTKPYMRLLTPNITPLTKLFQPNDFGLPYVNDITLLKSWIQDKSPDPTKNCLYIKVLLREESVGLNPLYGTLRMFDEGDAEFRIQPPKDIRSLDFRTDLSQLLETFQEISTDMPFNLNSVRLGKANITVDLDFKGRPPKNIRSIVESRLEYLGPIFQKISPPEGQVRPLFMLRYKAVSNFIREDTISDYLTYYITRKGLNDENIKEYTTDLAKQFEISEESALEKITDYLDKKKELTMSNSESKDFVGLTSSGTDISIVSKDVNTFSLHIYNLYSEKDLIRIISIISGVFFSEDDIWEDIFSNTVKSIEKIEEIVEQDSLDKEQIAAPAASVKFALEQLDISEDEEDEPPPPPPQVSKEVSKEQEHKIVAHKWFITRLQQIDVRLFGYPKVKGVSHYSSQCASNEDRYPAVFTEAQYQRMRKYYAKAEEEGKVGFIIYGVPNTDQTEKDALGKIEKISVLRYGSDSLHPNYYLCSEYYCLRDLLPVLKGDWESQEDYQGNQKPKNSCPFCGGLLITDPKDPDNGQTVLHRKVKPRSRIDKRHLHIGFLGEGKNPNGFDMPCCFIKSKKIGWMDPRFKRFRDLPKSAFEKTLDEKTDEFTEKKEELNKNLVSRLKQLVSYDLLKHRIHKEYVVGSEKHPLDPGKIGMPSVGLDNYFLQESSLYVARSAIKQEFKPNARGMFRLGVVNRVISLNDSLFSALAPALGKNNSQEVKEYLLKTITPRVFINLNFGNLLIEFFNPSDEEPTDSELSTWGTTHLQITKTGTEPELSRFYRSYHNFKKYIKDPTKKKLLRHFIHALAEPGLLVTNGLTIVSLMYQGDPRESTSTVKVLCPSLGYNIDRYEKNNITFLTYHESGIWEPLIYISKVVAKNTAPLHQEGFYSISYNDMARPEFPKSIRDRYKEFVSECRSSFRGAYTYQQGIDIRELLPITRALEILNKLNPNGLIRDSYNHLIAITIPATHGGVVIVPVVDDGNSFYNTMDLRIHIGLLSVDLASANDVENVYNSYITQYIGKISTIYTLDSFIKTDVGIIGYTVGSNIHLPCKDSIDKLKTPVETVEDDFQFEYEINRRIIIDGRDSKFELSRYLIQKEVIENIYQHLRLTFSRWVSTDSDGTRLRTFIKKLIERRDIPSFEKIRILEIELEPIIISWLSPDPDHINPQPVFLRSDCTAIEDPDKCSGYCQMSDGKCKIHTPDIFQISTNEKVVSTEYLSRRLIDEIVRLPVRANELLEKGVKRIQVPKTNVKIEDQWIIPQGVPAWYDLLRISDTVDSELPKFYEEFSRNNDDSIPPSIHLIELPDLLKNILPTHIIHKLALRVIGPENTYFFGILDDINRPINSDILNRISYKYNKPAIQIFINEEPPRIVGRINVINGIKSSCIVIVSGLKEGPALLVTHDIMSDSVPSEFIEGLIYDSIKFSRRRIVKKINTILQ